MSALATEAQIDGETLLRQWGEWARRMSDGLGYPRSSGIHRMIELVKVFEQRESQSQKSLTAQGKQKPVMKPRQVKMPPDGVMRVDAEIAKLPGWLQAPLHRAYLWNQPDRIAAREMGISRRMYTARREEAVDVVLARLMR